MMRLGLSEQVIPQYIETYLRSFYGRSCLTSNAKWAVNQASINQSDVARTVVPLPPLAEQQRIVAEVERRLSGVAVLEASLAANLARAGRLRQAILRRAFAGQLVAQDPADESAAVLLGRIRAGVTGRQGRLPGV
jgi:type I restriction enzyme S subunit